MTEILFKAKDGSGRPVNELIEADSDRDALAKLAARGYTEVLLLQDSETASRNTYRQAVPRQLRKHLANDEAAIRAKPGYATFFLNLLRHNRWSLLFATVAAAAGAVLQLRTPVVCGLAYVLLVLGPPLWRYRHGGRYNALLESMAHGDWEKSRRLIALLRNKRNLDLNLRFDLDIREGSILAREGDLQGGLAKAEPWRGNPHTARGFFESRVASIHAAGRNYPAFVECMEAALTALPDNTSRQVDAALANARFGDLVRARALMAAVDRKLLIKAGHPFLDWAEGAIALREDDIGAATQALYRGAAAFGEMIEQPAAWTAMAICWGQYGVALQAAGSREDALAVVERVWPVLQAHGDTPLLDRLSQDHLIPQ